MNIKICLGFETSFSIVDESLFLSLKIEKSPSLIGIINGKIIEFKGNFSLNNLNQFANSLIPSDLVYKLDRNNFNIDFINKTNKEDKVLAVLLTQAESNLSLSYQMPCFKMVDFIKCATIKKSKKFII